MCLSFFIRRFFFFYFYIYKQICFQFEKWALLEAPWREMLSSFGKFLQKGQWHKGIFSIFKYLPLQSMSSWALGASKLSLCLGVKSMFHAYWHQWDVGWSYNIVFIKSTFFWTFWYQTLMFTKYGLCVTNPWYERNDEKCWYVGRTFSSTVPWNNKFSRSIEETSIMKYESSLQLTQQNDNFIGNHLKQK